jgi:phosphoglycolate phosphatase
MARKILVLWDIDRTLLYAGDVDQQMYRELFADLVGGVPRRLPERGSGITTPIVLRRFFTENEVAAEQIDGLTRAAVRLLPRYLFRGRERLLTEGTVMPGAEEALRTVRDDPRFVSTVVTGNLRSTALIKLETFGLDVYLDLDSAGFASDDDHRPRLVGVAQERAGLRHGVRFSQANTVSVGDSLEDVRTAQLGGCQLLAIASGTTTAAELREAGADTVLEDLRDTAAVVTALAGLGGDDGK